TGHVRLGVLDLALRVDRNDAHQPGYVRRDFRVDGGNISRPFLADDLTHLELRADGQAARVVDLRTIRRLAADLLVVLAKHDGSLRLRLEEPGEELAVADADRLPSEHILLVEALVRAMLEEILRRGVEPAVARAVQRGLTVVVHRIDGDLQLLDE